MSFAHALRAGFAAAFLLAFPASAHEGHDDASAAAAPARPRVAVHTDLYEVVAVREAPDRLRIWLDLFDGNEPVTAARLEVAIGDAAPVAAEPEPDGTFRLESPILARTGQPFELVFSVTGGPAGDDLLAGSLPALPPPDPHTGPFENPWHAAVEWLAHRPWLVAAGGALAGLAGGAALARPREGRRPERRRAAAAAAAVLVLLLAPGAGGAGPGHAHDGGEAGGDAGGTAAMDAPSRLPDGTVFLPKVSQRLLEVRTATLREGEASRAVSLVGRVVADPNRGGLAQSIAGGRVVPPEGGLLRLGQTVRRGEVLAVVEQIRAAPEIVRAPADGVIASARVVAGQVVAAQDVLFQVVDPAGLWVEALVFGADAARDFREATASVRGGQPMRLTLQGFGRAVQQGATLAQFRIEDPPPDLALGQPVTVVARLAEPVRGLILPRAAVVRAASGERVVWRHVEPETFSAAPVRVEPLDAARVLVAAGLRAGERVVVQGAGLVNQVR